MMDHAIEVQRNERRSVFEGKEGGLGRWQDFPVGEQRVQTVGYWRVAVTYAHPGSAGI